jgi:hypothetical protein
MSSAHGAQKQFFLRRARTHFWAIELTTIRRYRGIEIVGREGFLGIRVIIRLTFQVEWDYRSEQLNWPSFRYDLLCVWGHSNSCEGSIIRSRHGE